MIESSEKGYPRREPRSILIECCRSARALYKLNLTKENQTRRGEEGLKLPQHPLSRPRWKSFKEFACLKSVTCTPFRTVNRWNRKRNWQTRRRKFWVTCHSGRWGNRLAKSRSITAHVTFGPSMSFVNGTLDCGFKIIPIKIGKLGMADQIILLYPYSPIEMPIGDTGERCPSALVWSAWTISRRWTPDTWNISAGLKQRRYC